MAKKNKDNKRGLGRGLDSLIPKIDEEEKSNKSSLTLEDILSNSEEEKNEINEEESSEKKELNEEKSQETEDKAEKKSKKEYEKKVSESKKSSPNENEKLEKEIEKIEEIEEIEDEMVKSEENADVIIEEPRKEKAVGNALEENVEVKKEEENKENEKEEQKELVLSDYELTSIEEVKEIIEKNPRITLWSTKSSAVFRYLRKTRPEFSISKEASELIDQAVSKKYPEIWKLFEDL